MRRLAALKRRGTQEDGATAVLVAVLLLVLLGMAALVLDVGDLVWERRQLQNSADAAALAAAHDFANLLDEDVALVTAREYADDNNRRGAHVEEFDVDLGAKTVRVVARTGSELLPGVLPSLLAGVIGHDDYFARAEATAKWGTVGGPLNVFPLGICDEPHYNDLTDNGTNFGGPPQEIYYGKDECEFNADTYPGGFGWLSLDGAEVDPASGTCSLAVTEDRWWLGRTGNDTNNAEYGDCIEALNNYLDSNGGEAPIYVPIFSDYCGPNEPPCGGGEHRFYIEGFAEFWILGYRFVGGPAGHYTYPNASACAGEPDPVCIVGYFEQFITYEAFVNEGAGDFGGTSVQLVK